MNKIPQAPQKTRCGGDEDPQEVMHPKKGVTAPPKRGLRLPVAGLWGWAGGGGAVKQEILKALKKWDLKG